MKSHMRLVVAFSLEALITLLAIIRIRIPLMFGNMLLIIKLFITGPPAMRALVFR